LKVEFIVQYLDEYLSLLGHPDYPTALNGLQVSGEPGRPIRRIGAAVDASEAVLVDAVNREVDLLLVHHGLFWGGLRPVTGRRYRKLTHLLTSGMALYSAHLPLDAHPVVGNCALLCRELGVRVEGRFGDYKGAEIGWWGRLDHPTPATELVALAARAVEGPARGIGDESAVIDRVGVITGGGAGFLEEASQRGLDALVTGEGAHHSFADAHELGVHLVLAGHYATETFGVKALGAQLAEKYDIDWVFLDHPSGL
jgi:dinuclear metal center YbgI/SA1388 family protein